MGQDEALSCRAAFLSRRRSRPHRGAWRNWRSASACPSSPPMPCSITPRIAARSRTCSPRSARNAPIYEAGLALEANAERHLKPGHEMARLFAGHEDALRRTIEIADACSFSLDELKYEYPDEPVPQGKTPQSHLEDLTWEGAAWRFPDGIPPKVEDTLDQGARADRGARLRALFPHRPRHRPLRALASASSARAAAPPRTPRFAIASPSPMSIRPRSTFCSSASSRRSGRSRRTSTSISSMSGARR